MNPIFKKMNYKNQSPILVLDQPESFESALIGMGDVTEIHQNIQQESYSFLIGFCEDAASLVEIIHKTAPLLEGDAIYWLAYPKKSSKKYSSDINRDAEAWRLLGTFGYEGVRQVAIDEDWSALRFRHVDYIKTMKRSNSMAMSEAGKKRTAKKDQQN